MVRLIAAATAAALALAIGSASAQELRQIALTEKQVISFIAARNEIAPIIEQQRRAADQPDLKKIEAEFDSIAKKHGLASLDEYEDVAANVWMIMAGLDPLTKAFTEPMDAIKKEIAEVEADQSIPAKEKAQILEELNDALKTAKPVQHRGNIELVKKHYEQLEAALQ